MHKRKAGNDTSIVHRAKMRLRSIRCLIEILESTPRLTTLELE